MKYKITGFLILLLFIAVGVYAAQGDFWTGGYDRANAVDDWRIDSNHEFIPGKDDTYDIGTSSLQVKDLYINGVAYIDDVRAPVVREIRFTPGEFTIGDSTIELTSSTSPTLAYANTLPSIVWKDGVTSPVQVTFRVPVDFSSGGNFRGMFDSDATTTPSVVDYDIYINVDGSQWDGTAENQATVALAETAGTVELVTLAALNATDADSVAAGSWITLRVWRDDAADGTDNLEMYYLEFYYNAKQ